MIRTVLNRCTALLTAGALFLSPVGQAPSYADTIPRYHAEYLSPTSSVAALQDAAVLMHTLRSVMDAFKSGVKDAGVYENGRLWALLRRAAIAWPEEQQAFVRLAQDPIRSIVYGPDDDMRVALDDGRTFSFSGDGSFQEVTNAFTQNAGDGIRLGPEEVDNRLEFRFDFRKKNVGRRIRKMADNPGAVAAHVNRRIALLRGYLVSDLQRLRKLAFEASQRLDLEEVASSGSVKWLRNIPQRLTDQERFLSRIAAPYEHIRLSGRAADVVIDILAEIYAHELIGFRFRRSQDAFRDQPQLRLPFDGPHPEVIEMGDIRLVSRVREADSGGYVIVQDRHDLNALAAADIDKPRSTVESRVTSLWAAWRFVHERIKMETAVYDSLNGALNELEEVGALLGENLPDGGHAKRLKFMLRMLDSAYAALGDIWRTTETSSESFIKDARRRLEKQQWDDAHGSVESALAGLRGHRAELSGVMRQVTQRAIDDISKISFRRNVRLGKQLGSVRAAVEAEGEGDIDALDDALNAEDLSIEPDLMRMYDLVSRAVALMRSPDSGGIDAPGSPAARKELRQAEVLYLIELAEEQVKISSRIIDFWRDYLGLYRQVRSMNAVDSWQAADTAFHTIFDYMVEGNEWEGLNLSLWWMRFYQAVYIPFQVVMRGDENASRNALFEAFSVYVDILQVADIGLLLSDQSPVTRAHTPDVHDVLLSLSRGGAASIFELTRDQKRMLTNAIAHDYEIAEETLLVARVPPEYRTGAGWENGNGVPEGDGLQSKIHALRAEWSALTARQREKALKSLQRMASETPTLSRIVESVTHWGDGITDGAVQPFVVEEGGSSSIDVRIENELGLGKPASNRKLARALFAVFDHPGLFSYLEGRYGPIEILRFQRRVPGTGSGPGIAYEGGSKTLVVTTGSASITKGPAGVRALLPKVLSGKVIHVNVRHEIDSEGAKGRPYELTIDDRHRALSTLIHPGSYFLEDTLAKFPGLAGGALSADEIERIEVSHRVGWVETAIYEIRVFAQRGQFEFAVHVGLIHAAGEGAGQSRPRTGLIPYSVKSQYDTMARLHALKPELIAHPYAYGEAVLSEAKTAPVMSVELIKGYTGINLWDMHQQMSQADYMVVTDELEDEYFVLLDQDAQALLKDLLGMLVDIYMETGEVAHSNFAIGHVMWKPDRIERVAWPESRPASEGLLRLGEPTVVRYTPGLFKINSVVLTGQRSGADLIDMFFNGSMSQKIFQQQTGERPAYLSFQLRLAAMAKRTFHPLSAHHVLPLLLDILTDRLGDEEGKNTLWQWLSTYASGLVGRRYTPPAVDQNAVQRFVDENLASARDAALAVSSEGDGTIIQADRVVDEVIAPLGDGLSGVSSVSPAQRLIFETRAPLNQTLLVVDDAVLDSPANDAFYRVLRETFGQGTVILFSEWQAHHRAGAQHEDQAAFVLSTHSKDRLSEAFALGEELPWARKVSVGFHRRAWVVPYHRLSMDLQLLGAVMQSSDDSLPQVWQTYLLEGIRGSVDERPMDPAELRFIEEEMLAVLDEILTAA